MGLMPQSLVEKIQFVEAHLADWAAHAVAVGSSATEVAAISTKAAAARAALTEQETAQDTAKTKTAALRQKVDEMVVATSDFVKKVRAKAATDGVGIYQLANIPAPAQPAPKGPPGLPANFVATVGQDGSVDLTWKCPNPPGAVGTTYQVYRRTTPTGDFVFLGASGEKRYLDSSIPAGSSQVTYKIRGLRSTAAGPWATFNVTFGMGFVTTTVVADATGPKMAA